MDLTRTMFLDWGWCEQGTRHHQHNDNFDKNTGEVAGLTTIEEELLNKELFVCRLIMSYIAVFYHKHWPGKHTSLIRQDRINEIFAGYSLTSSVFKNLNSITLPWLDESNNARLQQRCRDFDTLGYYGLVKEQLQFELLATQGQWKEQYDDLFIQKALDKSKKRGKPQESLSDFLKLVKTFGRSTTTVK